MFELYVDKNSIIHQLHPGMKLIVFLTFIFFLNLTLSTNYFIFSLYYVVLLFMVILSKIPIRLLAKRTLIALPFLLAAVPLIFDSQSAWVVSLPILNFEIGLSLAGVERFIGILIKAIISIQAAILLTSTTRFSGILFGLRFLRVPSIFVSVFGLTWRFLFILVEETQRMIHARDSRSSSSINKFIRSGGSLLWRGKVTGGMAGSLFIRSLERSDRIYQAMISRGYEGEALYSVLQDDSIGKLNLALLILSILLIISIWYFGFIHV